MVLVVIVGLLCIAAVDSYTTTICEDATTTVRCTTGNLRILHVFYGRRDHTTCGPPLTTETSCSASNATHQISLLCDGKQLCSIHADNSNFGDPCTGTKKYAIVDYKCEQPAKVDPCLPGNHKVISNAHRSTLFSPAPTDPYICDNSISPGWYVFEGFQEIPTSCVQKYHCGTHAPVWMNGKNPSMADGIVTRDMCINYGRNSNSNTHCCDNTFSIAVKNCGSHIVYHLLPTPSCPEGYCAGSQRVCEISSNNGTCVDKYPKMTKFPELGKPEVTPFNEVRFPCIVHFTTGIPDTAFNVTWTVDGVPLKDPSSGSIVTTTLTGDSRVAFLNATMLQGNLGKDLRCNVSSYHPSTPSYSSEPIPSNPYWVGIRVSKDHIQVDESGKEQELKLESTLPIVCNAMSQSECKLTVSLHQNTDPKDLSWSACDVDLKPDNGTHRYTATIKVKATRDFINDHNKIHEINFEPIQDFFHPTFIGYHIEPTHVTSVDKPHGHCLLHGDPHAVGLDYKKNYNLYDVGDMVIYRSKNQKRPFEVHARTWGCGHYHPCICAVTAREGNDVIEVDMCRRRMNRVAAPKIKVLSGHLEGTTLWRDRSGRNIYLNFASGTRIALKAYVRKPHHTHERDGMMNVDIQAPTDDLNSAEGLCGNWQGSSSRHFLGGDGNMYNARQVQQFSHSWLLSHHQSMFHVLPKYDSSFKPGRQYCSCKKNKVDCTNGNGAINPSKNVCSGGRCYKPHVATMIIRRRDIPLEHAVKPRSIANYNATYPTASGLTESQARQKCTDSIQKSSLYLRCQNVLSVPITSFIDACVEDMKYADGDLFSITHMDAFDNSCQNEVMKDVTTYTKSADGDLIPPADVTSDFCPNQCSERGTCVAGTCNCLVGYTSIDCSIKIGEAPVIDSIREDGICDFRHGSCDTVYIVGDNIWDIDSLDCRIQPIQIKNGSEVSIGSPTKVKAEFVNFMEMMCPIPQNLIQSGEPYQGYRVSISTDGRNYSSEHLYVIFDSHCFQCNDVDHCTLEKNTTCLIGGTCYRRGEQNSEQLVCDPSVTDVDWTPVPAVKEIDYYTATFSGCECAYDPSRFYCACCKNSGCQCGKLQPNRCSACNQKHLCGKYSYIFSAHR